MSQLNFIMDTDVRNGAIRGMLEGAYLDPDLTEELYQRLERAEARSLAAASVYYRLTEVDPRRAERYRVEAGITDEDPTSR